jgi:parvulin-like peptidyl-prolyl isomerase
MRIRAAIIFVAFLSGAFAAGSRGETVDRIVARVGDKILTEGELGRFLVAVREPYENSSGWGEETGRRTAIDHWVEQQLILRESKELKNFPLDAIEIDQQVEEQKSRFPSPEAFAAALAREGLDEKKLRERIEDSYRVRLLTYREVQSKINVSPREVMDYYRDHPGEFAAPEMVRISQIRIPYADKSAEPDPARERAQRVLEKLSAGEDFADLAREYSVGADDDRTGDMGYFEKGQLRNEVVALDVGGHTGILESDSGYLIIQVIGRKEAYAKPLSEVWGEIDDRISQEQYEKLYDGWMAKLRAKTFIKIEE